MIPNPDIIRSDGLAWVAPNTFILFKQFAQCLLGIADVSYRADRIHCYDQKYRSRLILQMIKAADDQAKMVTITPARREYGYSQYSHVVLILTIIKIEDSASYFVV